MERRARRLLAAAAVLLAVALMTLVSREAQAESYQGMDDWLVSYTRAGTLHDNYSEREYVDSISELEPGDDITFVVHLSHENGDVADWYLSNQVISSLEDSRRGAEGSAYGYHLSYEGPSNSRVLYDSEKVGGTDSEGLNEATNAMEDYLFLGRLAPGETAEVRLRVTLDGETEGNAYFNTLAQLKLGFGVDPWLGSRGREGLVKTGDNPWLLPVCLTMLVSGLALLALGLRGLRTPAEERKTS